ncbi:Trehalose-phosphate synthase [Phycisphaerae bacterium RAS1]|nr:Trehalose-phosphate synthase [Phycisphaerae bacterium RAS1]
MRLLIVSNRLPISIERDEQGACSVRHSSGGLVTALGAVLRRSGGVWVGWPGAREETAPDVTAALREQAFSLGYPLRPVSLSRVEYEGFYQGYANEIIWPLFHDLQSRCNFVPDYWQHYLTVKAKYADAVLDAHAPGDFVWVHDYQLMGLGRELRERGCESRIGFFLHIPFPPPDIFAKLPWRVDVLRELLSYDIIGLQTPRDRENFLDCVRRLLPAARIFGRTKLARIEFAGHAAHLGVFPIGIDFGEFARHAASGPVTQRVQELRSQFSSAQIVLGIDRLDYTKGIPDRIRAFELALKRYPELHRAVTLVQVVVPSREHVPEYQDLKARIERGVAQVNGAYSQPGWVPIHYVFRSVERAELLAYYRAADVALITPLKDGMNLVAKEYCASQSENNGVLILSEFAGAAFQLAVGATLVNPHDHESVAAAIRRAVTMSRLQRHPAMRRLRRNIKQQDVFWWVRQFFEAAGVDIDLEVSAPC